MIKAIIVDNEKPAIDILKILLEKTGQVSVVGSFMKAADAYANYQSLNPDVAFLDIEMPETTGVWSWLKKLCRLAVIWRSYLLLLMTNTLWRLLA